MSASHENAEDEKKASSTVSASFNVKFELIPKTCGTQSPGSLFNQLFPGYLGGGLIRSEPGGCVLGSNYRNHAEKIYNFKTRPDDVWVVTMAKCGTTWTQELVWLLVNNCDTQAARQESLWTRSPFIEFPYMFPDAPDMLPPYMKPLRITVDEIGEMPSPRVIKSHLPFNLLPQKLLEDCKVVYVARNPKDAIVSFFHHHRLIKFHQFDGNLEQFAQYYMDDEVFFTPFFQHVLGAWNKRHHPNLHFMFYEDMKRDLRGEIQKVANFLSRPVTTEQLDVMVDHLKIDKFKKNESVNAEDCKEMGFMHKDDDKHFVRKGKTGDWKNHFSPELNKQIDQWIEKNLAGTDLRFVTELDEQD